MYHFTSPSCTLGNTHETWGWTQRLKTLSVCPAHINIWVILCSRVVTSKSVHVQLRYSDPDNSIEQMCSNERQNNDASVMPVQHGRELKWHLKLPTCLTLLPYVTLWIMSQADMKWHPESWYWWYLSFRRCWTKYEVALGSYFHLMWCNALDMYLRCKVKVSGAWLPSTDYSKTICCCFWHFLTNSY